MLRTTRVFSAGLSLLGGISLFGLGGCGLYVPEKNLIHEVVPSDNRISPEGAYESNLVALIKCETGQGLLKAYGTFKLPWLKSWGTAVTLTITTEEQSSANPSGSITNPIGTAASMQSFTAGFGATGSANATRTETIQFTYRNTDLMAYASNNIRSDGTLDNCHNSAHIDGLGIEGDLKIADFIYDKSVVAATGNATARNPFLPLYNTFTEEVIFVAAFGGNFTPTWKLTRSSVDSSGNLLSATRTKTNDLVVTLGPLQTPTPPNSPVQLSSSAQNQHNARVAGGATATSTQAQTPTH